MSKWASLMFATAGLMLAGAWIAPALALQGGAQQQPDATALTPPPAYTPPPKGAPPIEDTPAQREALAKWKARAEQKQEADRTEYNSKVTGSYNYHYGKGNPYLPGNVHVQGE